MNLPFVDSIEQQTRNYLADQTDISESQRERIKGIETAVDALLADLAKEERHIQNDARLTPSTKADDINKLRQDYAARLQRITSGEVAQISKRLAELEIELRPQPPATDPVVDELRLQEIRRLLKDTDELMILANYQVWATEGTDDTAMRAIEGAPQFAPLIHDPSILEFGAKARAMRHNPKSAALLNQLRQMQGLLKNIIGSAQAQIGAPQDDMLSRIAKGELENTD